MNPGAAGTIGGPAAGSIAAGAAGSITSGGGAGGTAVAGASGATAGGGAGTMATAGSGGAGGAPTMEGPPAPANSWTMMGGDARNTHFNAGEETLSVAKRSQHQGAEEVHDLRLSAGLVILDSATGNELERFDTGGTIAAGAAAIVDGKIVVKSGLEYALAILTPVTANTEVRCYGLQ